MFNYGVNVPISRFRRELNSWMRFLEKNPENTIYLTKNKKAVICVISPQQHENLRLELKEK
jgi:hypothetical protein